MSYGGRNFSRGRGGGRGGGYGYQRDNGPPDQIIEIGSFLHAVEDEMLCSSLVSDKVPHFNAPIFLQNKSMIGKIDEILGPINEVYFSIKMGEGMVANSFKKGDKVYIGVDKLLPIERFLPKPKVKGGVNKFRRGGRGAPTDRGRGQSTRGSYQRGGYGGRGSSGGFSSGGFSGGRGSSGGFPGGRGRGGMRGRGAPRGRGFRH